MCPENGTYVESTAPSYAAECKRFHTQSPSFQNNVLLTSVATI